MNFIYQNYLMLVVFLFVVIVAFFLFLEKRFFDYIKQFWFFKRSLFNILSSLCLVIGFFLFCMILLDPRGPEQKVKTKVKKDQTILLIDTSTSMLAEDVKPNRIEKAIWMAKNFTRSAVGHELAVLIFADITKKLVPFTNDVDLLESRLDSIKEIRNLNAGSSIEQAIAEAVYFFPKGEDVSGNIIVFTDGEETHDEVSFNLPNNIHVIMIGVGTKTGGPIP
jgi:Ca-activated chloride channel family protein